MCKQHGIRTVRLALTQGLERTLCHSAGKLRADVSRVEAEASLQLAVI